MATWNAVVGLRIRQNSVDSVARTDTEALADLAPCAQRNDAAVKRRFLASAHRPALEEHLGSFVFERWQRDIANDSPAIAEQLARERRLVDAYNAALSVASTTFAGTTHSLVTLGKHAESNDRSLREAALRAGCGLLDANRAELDSIFDELVRCRHGISVELGARNFTEIAYRRLGRTDYGPSDVAAFRSEIEQHIVPLAAKLAASQAQSLGVSALMPWDERVFDLGEPPAAASSALELEAQLPDALHALCPELGAFAELLLGERLLDLECRPQMSYPVR